MATALWSIGLVLFATLVGSLGPIYLKKASGNIHRQIHTIIFNKNLIIGVFFYGLSTVLFLPALKGGDISVLYPLVATSYIWVSFLSIWMLKEKMNVYKWIGILIIIIGVAFIGLGS